MTPNCLKKRTKQFGLRIIQLVETLPKTQTAFLIGKQLLRCATAELLAEANELTAIIAA